MNIVNTFLSSNCFWTFEMWIVFSRSDVMCKLNKTIQNKTTHVKNIESMIFEKTNINLFYKIGGITCIIMLVYSFLSMYIMAIIGTPPTTIEETFFMLSENRVNGLLRLDILTVFIMPLYYVLFYILYLTLKDLNNELVTISTILVFAGLTLFLAAPSVFSYLHLSDKYANAITEIEKSQLISAGQAIQSSDIWNGTGAKLGGLLIQIGALLISIVMLKGDIFNKVTAWVGIVTHSLDFFHILIGFFLPNLGVILMMIAGPLYLLWFPLVGMKLLKLRST